MSRFLRLSLLVTAILLMIACGLSTSATPEGGNTILAEPSVLKLTVAAQPATFNQTGQVINYTYTVTNNGTAALVGQVTITDNKVTATCPNVNTVGNKDDKLDPAESIICTGTYTVAQGDVTAGSITSTSRARAGNLDSDNVNTAVALAENKVLTIAVAANPTSYSQANQTITYTYTVKNTGATPLGPAQFVVRDDRFPSPINCGANNAIIAPNESLTCQSTYTITTNDMSATQITNTVTASGAGAGTIQAGSVTVNNTNVSAGGPGNNPNFPRGSNVQHTVVDGEWMLQIAR